MCSRIRYCCPMKPSPNIYPSWSIHPPSPMPRRMMVSPWMFTIWWFCALRKFLVREPESHAASAITDKKRIRECVFRMVYAVLENIGCHCSSLECRFELLFFAFYVECLCVVAFVYYY